MASSGGVEMAEESNDGKSDDEGVQVGEEESNEPLLNPTEPKARRTCCQEESININKQVK